MTVESATWIEDLNPSEPDGSIARMNEVDDHLNLIKAVLQAQFPNLGASAVSLTAAELSTTYLPSGTKMLFYQASPPTGWTAVGAAVAGSALRVVAPAGTGGTANNPSGDNISDAFDLAHTHADNITYASNGAHTHTGATGASIAGGGISVGLNSAASSVEHTHAISSDGSHTHSKSGGVQGVSVASAVQFQFKYMDVITCSKNA